MKIGTGIICKNEELDLPICLRSIASVADLIWIVDTGSTDGTKEVVKQFASEFGFKFYDSGAPGADERFIYFQTYTDASELEDGQWKLWSFSKARNQFVEAIDQYADWCLWMDSDDTLLEPNLLRSITGLPFDAFGLKIVPSVNETVGFVHHRLWKTKRGVRFEGACHEYPAWPTGFRLNNTELRIQHSYAQHASQEPGISRNLRILAREYERWDRSTRTLFYYANSLREAGKLADAAKVYQEYLETKWTFHDEAVFCFIYLVRCLRGLGRIPEAFSWGFKGIALDQRYAELWMELSRCYCDCSEFVSAIAMAEMAKRPLPQSVLFLEKNQYTDQPWRMQSWCYLQKGDFKKSLEATLQVLRLVPDDRETLARTQHLITKLSKDI